MGDESLSDIISGITNKDNVIFTDKHTTIKNALKEATCKRFSLNLGFLDFLLWTWASYKGLDKNRVDFFPCGYTKYKSSLWNNIFQSHHSTEEKKSGRILPYADLFQEKTP